MQLICARLDGFRVDTGYFRRKTRFAPGICPRCNGPIKVVADGTDAKVPKSRILLIAEGSVPAGTVLLDGLEDPAADVSPTEA